MLLVINRTIYTIFTMAQFKKNGALRGVIGAGYIRSFLGKEIFQTLPDRSRQNKANNKLAPLMKHIAHNLTFLRKDIQLFLGNRHESYMHSKFTGRFLKILHQDNTTDKKDKTIFSVDCADATGFEFNSATLFNDTFTAPIVLTLTAVNQIKVHLAAFVPAAKVIFPKNCTHALLRLKLFTLQQDFKTTLYDQPNEITLTFAKNTPIVEEYIAFLNPLDAIEKLDIVVAEIQFYYEINSPKQRMLFNSQAYNPSRVFYAK